VDGNYTYVGHFSAKAAASRDCTPGKMPAGTAISDPTGVPAECGWDFRDTEVKALERYRTVKNATKIWASDTREE